MDQTSTFYSLQVIWDSDSDTEVSSVNKQTDATGLDHEKTTSTLHRLQIIWDADNDIENSSLDKQTDATRSDHEQPGEIFPDDTDPSVSTETTGQGGEGQTLQNKPNQGQGTSDEPAIEDLLKNCQKYKDELQMVEILKGAVEEYKTLLKKAKETGCQQQKSTPPPSELNSVHDIERNQAPLLYSVIAFVSEKVPSYKRWREAVSEFIILTTLSQSEPKSSQKKRTKSKSGYQNKSKPPAKSYNNSIEKLLDQDWGQDRAPGPSVYNDYRHLFTCECVLRSTFPEADIFSLVDSTIRGPEDVPPELQHKALFHFLLSFNRKKYGLEPSDAWRDFGRLVLAEKQLDLARNAQPPDLHQNVLVKRLDFYTMQNELKEKTEEVEELSERLNKYKSKELTEGNPNIADMSDTHRPTRLGEMYSQLFDDEWSEAFEAFKPKTEDEDDDIFPDTLYILRDLLTNIFEFCKDQSKSQKLYIEDSFAVAIELKEQQVLKKRDAATQTDNTFDKNNSGHQAIKNSGQRDHSQQTYKDIVGEELFNQTPNEKNQKESEEGKTDTDKSNSSQIDQAQEKDDKRPESKDYRKSVIYPTIYRHARDFQKAAASTSAKTKSKLFIVTELPALIADETVRADVRVLTYVRKCVELCWYMCMQDPPMVIISPRQGQLVDKALFSFHGRRGKIVELCVWPALLLHDNGPLVCKGYVLPEERNRNR